MGKAPLFVRPPTDAERQALEDSLRSSDAFVLRRAPIILASARGETVVGGASGYQRLVDGEPLAMSADSAGPRHELTRYADAQP
jgi:hypothetical protein